MFSHSRTLLALLACFTLAHARALPNADQSAPTNPALWHEPAKPVPTAAPSVKEAERRVEYLHKRSLLQPAVLYDTPYTPSPQTVATVYRASTGYTNKNAFLTWMEVPKADDDTGPQNPDTWTDNVDIYPHLNFAVDTPDNVPRPSGMPAASTTYGCNIDTGSSAIIFGPDKVGTKDNIANIDGHNYNGYQIFPGEDGGKVWLGRWTKVKITLTGNAGTADQNVIATPTVLIATAYATNCAGFVTAPTDWPVAGDYSETNRNLGPGSKKPDGTAWTVLDCGGGTSATIKDVSTLPSVRKAVYFGIGWGNFNKGQQLPLNGQFVRMIQSLKVFGGSTYTTSSDTGVGCVEDTSTTNCKINRGYTIGRAGIQFGMVRNDDCLYYPLPHSAFDTSDWTRPVGCITFYDASGTASNCQQGEILPDSGQQQMTVQLGKEDDSSYFPGFQMASQTTGGSITSGAKMMLSMGFPLAGHSYQSGRWMTPTVVFGANGNTTPNTVNTQPQQYTPQSSRADVLNGKWSQYGSFVNTGRRFFDIYDMCYDPMIGKVGFRPKRMAVTWVGQGTGSTQGLCTYC